MAAAPAADSPPAKRAKPNVIFDMTTVDTGETKKVFGHTARHFITTTKQTGAPEMQSDPTETVEDVWYLDVPDVTQCDRNSHRPGGVLAAGGGITSRTGSRVALPAPVPEFHFHGPDPVGLTLSSIGSRASLTFTSSMRYSKAN